MEVDTYVSNISKIEPCSSNADKNSSKLGLCEVCAFRDARYTCPRCEVKTCSLKCNKIHKLEIECDGQRDRTKFVPMNKFSNLDLSSDYRLLEEISRNVETSRKKFGRRFEDIPTRLLKLKNAAKDRNITLKFLPYKFARRRSNLSFVNFKSNLIFWNIDWIFVNADNFKISDVKIPETDKIGAILSRHLNGKNEIIKETLQYYQAADLSGVRIFLKAEQKSGKKFYELDLEYFLRESLQKKLIIEYPTIHVVLKDHACAYAILDSDDEAEDMDIDGHKKSGKDIVNSIINNAESEESLYKSLKNLLFVSEYSDEEISAEGEQSP